jgi:MerR family copper efflux transcriptional regulator
LPRTGRSSRNLQCMRIGQLAVRAGTTTKTLRFYERFGLLPHARRTPAGYRDYDESVLDRLTFVKAAQAAGLTLGEIRDVIAARDHIKPPCQHLGELLDVYTAELDDRIELLRALRAEVQRLRDRTTRLGSAECGETAVCRSVPSA